MISPAKRFGKLRLFAVPLLAASALALFSACGGNPGQQKFVAKLALFGQAAPENPGALLRMQKGAMYVSEDVARPPVYAPDEDWLDGALAEIQAREAMEV